MVKFALIQGIGAARTLIALVYVENWLDKLVGQMCGLPPENVNTTPTEGIGNSWGWEGSQKPKMLRNCMKVNRNFQRGWRGLEKILSGGGGGGMGDL